MSKKPVASKKIEGRFGQDSPLIYSPERCATCGYHMSGGICTHCATPAAPQEDTVRCSCPHGFPCEIAALRAALDKAETKVKRLTREGQPRERDLGIAGARIEAYDDDLRAEKSRVGKAEAEVERLTKAEDSKVEKLRAAMRSDHELCGIEHDREKARADKAEARVAECVQNGQRMAKLLDDEEQENERLEAAIKDAPHAGHVGNQPGCHLMTHGHMTGTGHTADDGCPGCDCWKSRALEGR